MPELPEVETIKRGLSDKIVGRKITDIDILWHKSFIGDKKSVIGFEVVEIARRAKVIQIKLSNNLNLLFHLKLTGQIIHEHEIKSGEDVIDFAGGHPSHDWHAQMPNSNTRIIFTFNDYSKLFFNDMRKFGWCKVLTDLEVEEIYKKDYGLEPLDEDFDTDYLLAKAKNIPNRTIKQFLLDQTIAAGMGNIYTDEALFGAGIMPTRKVKEIKMSEWPVLILKVQKVLKLGIEHGGTTDSDYVNVDGKKGGMQDYLKVYHKVGEPCANNCGGKIERMVVGGRGTHFCANCQK
ncbi:MAG: bifunctional DNA-formamidopyrimidine glycosylase/DNA-(apurinic or apyrimidinic site) lyase [Candidatus Berkelbacteria bacterium]